MTISPENCSASVIFTLREPENGYASAIFKLVSKRSVRTQVFSSSTPVLSKR